VIRRSGRWPLVGLIVGIIGLVGACLIDLHAALAVYLAGAVTIAALPLGALAVLMIAYLVRGEWTEQMRAPLTAAALTMPIAGVLFVPVLLGLHVLYPWARDGHAVHGAFQAGYLVPWFFALRTIAYFVVWSAVAVWVLRAWGDVGRMNTAASAGLIVYALTASIAGIDWLESLEPGFHSSIYGLLMLTFQLVAGMAFATLMVAIAAPRPADLHPYGALLLSALLLWGYIQAMQYIIIWAGNIPDEVSWYLRRMEAGWTVVTWGLMVLQFVLPFFALLSDRVRSGAAPLMAIAGLTLALRFVEALWLALPEIDVSGPVLLLAIPAAVLAAGGAWLLALGFSLHYVARMPFARLRTAEA